MKDHDWHMFDAELAYEIRTVAGIVEVRHDGKIKKRLTPEEFEQWRREGGNRNGSEP
jgi:hypothetical protein